jgi:hypothetical protein
MKLGKEYIVVNNLISHKPEKSVLRGWHNIRKISMLAVGG